MLYRAPVLLLADSVRVCWALIKVLAASAAVPPARALPRRPLRVGRWHSIGMSPGGC